MVETFIVLSLRWMRNSLMSLTPALTLLVAFCSGKANTLAEGPKTHVLDLASGERDFHVDLGRLAVHESSHFGLLVKGVEAIGNIRVSYGCVKAEAKDVLRPILLR